MNNKINIFINNNPALFWYIPKEKKTEISAQLCFFEDIDYTEDVDFVIPNPPTQKEIQKFLCDTAIAID